METHVILWYRVCRHLNQNVVNKKLFFNTVNICLMHSKTVSCPGQVHNVNICNSDNIEISKYQRVSYSVSTDSYNTLYTYLLLT